jgi:hypothetical protein
MKFDCGETQEEKQSRLREWHRFFCIWPRRVGYRDCRWLETIERKGDLVIGYIGNGINGFCWKWEYRPIQPIVLEPDQPWPRK